MAEKAVQTCFACTMCNKCGRYDKIKKTLGVRTCYKCGHVCESDDEKVCPECGCALPPPFPKK